MGKDLSKYMYEYLIENADNYQWKIEINENKNAIEIYFVILIETQNIHYVQDVNAQVNDSSKIYFEEVICFYNEKDYKIIPENYLIAIPVNVEKGLEQGYVDAFLKQLNIIITNSYSEIREFLSNEQSQEYKMNWSDKNFKNTINTLIKTNKYSNRKLSFSTSENESLVSQLKEETYNGLERI